MARSPQPLALRKLRDLDLKTASGPGQQPFLSAASGLVRSGNQLYVVADDELHLGRFSLDDPGPGTLLRLFPGELPDSHELRRKRKPDLEILLQLPPSPRYGHGAVLALGSGSRRHRCRGALLPLDANGGAGLSVEIDAAPLFTVLGREFDTLNLEGGWVGDGMLWLLQRGNKRASCNALVGLPLDAMLRALYGDQVLASQSPQVIHEFDLGSRDGVPLCFTDGCALPGGGWVFCAVAEDTQDPGLDGEFLGAAAGRVDAQHQVQWLRPASPLYKLEGISARAAGAGWQLLLVADADDPSIPSSLLSAAID